MLNVKHIIENSLFAKSHIQAKKQEFQNFSMTKHGLRNSLEYFWVKWLLNVDHRPLEIHSYFFYNANNTSVICFS